MDNFFIWAREVIGIGPKDMKAFFDDNKDILEKIFIKKCFEGPSYDEKNFELDTNEFLGIIMDKGRIYFSKKIMDKIGKCGYSQDVIDDIKNDMRSRMVSYICYDSDDYPDLLRNVYDPPYILYYYGDISIVNSYPLLSVVGARKCTEYGKNAAKYLVRDLAESGIGIVSGLAVGIDSYAQKYCLEGGSPTIAVMGTAIDNIYPKSNKKLFKQIIDQGGLILSETGPGRETFRASFAIRNRIIAGLSRGILVIEAGKKSGSLITARYGLDNGREVYLVPGSIFSELSYGCNEMISMGGKMVMTSQDILEDYRTFYTFDCLNNKKNNKNTGNNPSVCVNIRNENLNWEEFSEHERDILKLLSEKGALEIDKISSYLNMEVGEVIFCVNNLSMMDYIFEVGINTYELNKVLII